MKKKILFLVSTLANSGPTNQLYGLVKNLDQDIFSISLLTLSQEPEIESSWGRFDCLGLEMDSLRLSRFEGILLAWSRLRDYIDNFKPDLVHTQGIRADILNAARIHRSRSLCTARNYPYLDYPSKFGRFRGRVMAMRHTEALRQINVVACSHAIATQLATHGIAPFVVQNGVDLDSLHPVDGTIKASLRNRLGLPQDALIVVSVGSLIPRKDMLTVTKAYQAAHLGVNSRLVVLGSGPLESDLRKLAHRNVLLRGHVANVKDYLNAADIFISASLAEGLPNTVLEAMATGLPCILSDISSHRELQEDDNLFFQCGDVSALSSRLLAIADEEHLSSLGCKARRNVQKRFSVQKMAAEYQEIYHKLLEAQGG